MLKGLEEWESGLVQGHTSSAAAEGQETAPASATTTCCSAVLLSPSPEAGDGRLEYRAWLPRSRCNIACPASQLQKGGLCLPSSFEISHEWSPQQGLGHIQRLLRGPLGKGFRAAFNTEPADGSSTATSLEGPVLSCSVGRGEAPLPPCPAQPPWLLLTYCPLRLQLRNSRGKGCRDPRTQSLFHRVAPVT